MNKPDNKDGTVGKALEILDLVAGLGRPVRFTELLSLSPHPKATLYRFLQTLTNQGMLSYDEERICCWPISNWLWIYFFPINGRNGVLLVFTAISDRHLTHYVCALTVICRSV